MTLLLEFILAHLIGDFFLQCAKTIEQKNRLKWAAPSLYIHGIIHFGLILIIAGLEYWLAAAIITVIHIIIDGTKLQFQSPKNVQIWFFIDQLLHFVAIVAVWAWLSPEVLTGFSMSISVLAAAIGYIFLTRPAAFIIAQSLSHWNQDIIEDGGTEKSLPKAGWYIGMLERILIFSFILIGQWGAIGFLMAAKSIFRFGDLTRAKDRKLTEYILIGTFLSFGVAILSGIIVVYYFSGI